MIVKFYFKFIKFKSYWQVAQAQPGGMKTRRTTDEYYQNKKGLASSKQKAGV